MNNNGIGAQQRPSLWSYVSGSFNTPRRRSSSLTLPKHDRRREDNDPYEKAGRHGSYSKQKQESMSEKVQAAWMNQGTRARYIKTGCLIFFVLAVLYYIIPGGRYASVPGTGKFPGGDVASDPSVATSKCSRSYSKDKPLIQYALMVDAGSTGSRIHVYKFNNCGPTPELEDEIFQMTEKREGGSGLSSYKGDAEGAAALPLIEHVGTGAVGFDLGVGEVRVHDPHVGHEVGKRDGAVLQRELDHPERNSRHVQGHFCPGSVSSWRS